jgi:hypothetical protein
MGGARGASRASKYKLELTMRGLEQDIVAGAIAALRRRAARQAGIAKVGTTIGEHQAVIRSGEAAVAARLAEAFGGLAHDIERGGIAKQHISDERSQGRGLERRQGQAPQAFGGNSPTGSPSGRRPERHAPRNQLAMDGEPTAITR